MWSRQISDWVLQRLRIKVTVLDMKIRGSIFVKFRNFFKENNFIFVSFQNGVNFLNEQRNN